MAALKSFFNSSLRMCRPGRARRLAAATDAWCMHADFDARVDSACGFQSWFLG
jgi:hypothetical protein